MKIYLFFCLKWILFLVNIKVVLIIIGFLVVFIVFFLLSVGMGDLFINFFCVINILVGYGLEFEWLVVIFFRFLCIIVVICVGICLVIVGVIL